MMYCFKVLAKCIISILSKADRLSGNVCVVQCPPPFASYLHALVRWPRSLVWTSAETSLQFLWSAGDNRMSTLCMNVSCFHMFLIKSIQISVHVLCYACCAASLNIFMCLECFCMLFLYRRIWLQQCHMISYRCESLTICVLWARCRSCQQSNGHRASVWSERRGGGGRREWLLITTVLYQTKHGRKRPVVWVYSKDDKHQ